MNPASEIRSGECGSIASASAASNSPREANARSSTTWAERPACALNFKPAASGRLLSTAATCAGTPARTIASMLLPLPEIRMTIFFMRSFYRPSIHPLDAVALLFDQGEHPARTVEVVRADGDEGATLAQGNEQAVRHHDRAVFHHALEQDAVVLSHLRIALGSPGARGVYSGEVAVHPGLDGRLYQRSEIIAVTERMFQQRHLCVERDAIEHRNLLLYAFQAQHAQLAGAREFDKFLVQRDFFVVFGGDRDVGQRRPGLEPRDHALGHLPLVQDPDELGVGFGADQRLEPAPVLELARLEEAHRLALALKALRVVTPGPGQSPAHRIGYVEHPRIGKVDGAEHVAGGDFCL